MAKYWAAAPYAWASATLAPSTWCSPARPRTCRAASAKRSRPDAPIGLLESTCLIGVPNDFAREPGAAPNFAGIQAMFDIYAETGMIKQKLDVSQFKHPSIVAPIE